MWLLNVETLQLESYVGHEIPPYAILSHVWGKEEVNYQEVTRQDGRDKAGWTKIKSCCERAGYDGLAYCWIDTCCIDKTSSVELQEAINST